MRLRAEKISRQYFRKQTGTNVFYALKETDFLVEPGLLTMLEGRSGGGKSTLLNILGGLLKPSTGRVLADDTDLYSLNDKALSVFRNRHIGMIPQVQTGIHSLTVTENILLPYTLFGDTPDSADYFEELLNDLDIEGIRDAMPSELSGGEMRRMAIARSLIRKPEIILADEPTGDLDDENTEAVLKLLQKAAGNGAAVFLVTHENVAADYADRRFRMDGGSLK